MSNEITVTLVRSLIGRPSKHKAIIAGLGLRRCNTSVVLVDSPSVRGMINKVVHLVKVS